MSRNMLIVSLIFGMSGSICMIFYYSILRNEYSLALILSSLVFGLLSSFIYGYGMTYVAKKLFKKVILEVDPDEVILREARANHFKGKEAVGGKLALTDRRLIFKSHKYNLQNHQESYNLDQVDHVFTKKNLMIFNTGLIISLKSGVLHKFVVDEPEIWSSLIMNKT